MKQINLYLFSELSKEAQTVAIEAKRSEIAGRHIELVTTDIVESKDAFCEHFECEIKQGKYVVNSNVDELYEGVKLLRFIRSKTCELARPKVYYSSDCMKNRENNIFVH